jgi:hypothetical protein
MEETHFVSSLNKTGVVRSIIALHWKLSQGKYLKEKFKKVKGAVKRKIFNLTNSTGNDSSGEGEMIEQLKEKFHILGKKSEMVQMLMVFLKRWLIRNIQQDFTVPNYMVLTFKKLVVVKGIL